MSGLWYINKPMYVKRGTHVKILEYKKCREYNAAFSKTIPKKGANIKIQFTLFKIHYLYLFGNI